MSNRRISFCRPVPRYRKHRASGQAVVTLSGKDHYLGPHGTSRSKAEYDRVVSEWLANGRRLPGPGSEQDELTIAEIAIRYWQFAKSYYVKNGKPTGTLAHIKVVLKVLRRTYGYTRAVDFGPLALKTIREKLLAPGHCRKYVNEQVATIVRMFRWAVAEELVPPTVYQALKAVPRLRKGRTAAPDRGPVVPVTGATVQTILPHLPLVVADMVRFQRLTGARPSEVCLLRPCDIDRSDDVWAYRPGSHKTEHQGRQRVIYIGPKARDILRPYLLRPAETYCFTPLESERRRRAEQRSRRKTKVQPSQMNRCKRRPRWAPGCRYNTDSYRRAIHRACDRAGVKRWGPNRLRHSCATEVRRQFGLEAAQVVLGHASADITQLYAERDQELAKAVVRKIG